jgi:hypothetical protein
MAAPMSTDVAAPLLRCGLLWLGALTAAGIGIELAVERHWTQPIQWVAWGALALMAVALALMVGRPSRSRVRLARILSAVVIVSAVLGIWEHVEANHDAGELDYRYGETWETLPAAERWWLAISKTVGPSPPLAPGALAQASLCVLLATLRHPALEQKREP